MVRKYEGLYIFVGAAKDELLEKTVEKMRGEITRLSGTILHSEVLGKRTFARQMRKCDYGVYVRIRFELDPASLATLRERYHLAEDLFRVQLQVVDERREAIIAEQSAKQKAREAMVAARAETAAAEA
ncbi:MAG: 30S ribosomal protein S6 [bacterium]